MDAFRRGFLLFGLLAATFSQGLRADDDLRIVARVNGQEISSNQVQLQFIEGNEGHPDRKISRQKLVERLVDRELIRQFLKQQRVVADPQKLDAKIQSIESRIAQRGEVIHDVLERYHITRESLREELSLQLAWDQYVESTISDSDLKSYWKTHHAEWDGTRVKAAQIVLLIKNNATEEDWIKAEATLTDLLKQIESGKTTFTEAAKVHSQSPSARNGGDLGEFEYHDRVIQAISSQAFSLKPGQISKVFRSKRGVHVVQLNELIPGQLVLEDVRMPILNHLSSKLWDEQVQKARSVAKVEILDGK
ncbi:peptidylprolyl isomerase [Planctomicrobium sp. SH668]|uniref:peptidylprolyl isomerase n=1 Tax=Planctomicrobium sp. SH668 TaxID=3448126 RepID=UPI003F5BEC79